METRPAQVSLTGIVPADDDPVLLKPSATVHMPVKYSHPEHKLLNVLMQFAQDQGHTLHTDWYRIGIPEVFGRMGWKGSKNVDALKEYLRGLLGKTVEWNYAGVDRAQQWDACPFLAHGRIVGKELHFKIHSFIYENTLKPLLYSQMRLAVQSEMRSKRSLLLYEFAIDMRDRGQTMEFRLSLDELYDQLDGRYKRYTQSGGFRYFNQEALKPAVAEVNKHTDIEIRFKTVRMGRRIGAIDFTIRQRESYQQSLVLRPHSEPEADEAAVRTLLSDFGVRPKTIENLFSRYSLDRVARNARYTQTRQRAGLVKKPAAYAAEAVRKDWAKLSPDEEAELAVKGQREAAAQNAKEAERWEKAYQAARSYWLRQRFESKTKTWKTRRRNLFMKDVLPENQVVARQFKKQGWESSAVTSVFLANLSEELLQDAREKSVAGFREWASAEGMSLADVEIIPKGRPHGA